MLARSSDLAFLFSPAFVRKNPCGMVMEHWHTAYYAVVILKVS
jgi:hypothetical protein